MRLRVLAVGLFSIIAATSVSADDCIPGDPRLLSPDLVAQPPDQIRIVTHNRHRLLSFSTTIANVGDGPLILQGETVDDGDGLGTFITQAIRRTNNTVCTRDIGFFPFTGEEHYRIDDFAEYQLRRGDPFTGPVVARLGKSATCMTNNVRLRGYRGTPAKFDCANPNAAQGISAGFGNVEEAQAPGQTIDLDADPAHPVPPGDYFLVIVVNANRAILEKIDDPQANAGVASVTVAGRVRVPRVRPSPRPRPSRHTPVPTPTPTRTLAPPTATPTAPPLATPTTHLPSHSRAPIVLPPGHEGCGGNLGKLCSPGEFCQFGEGRCGLHRDLGLCVPTTQGCGPGVAQVCGCNGVTYRNDCERKRGGVSVAHQGPC